MAVDPPSSVPAPGPLAPDPYPAIFRQQILRSLHYLQGQILAASGLVPSQEVAALALHVLDYALTLAAQQPEAWHLSGPALAALAPGMEQAGHRADWAGYLRRGLDVAHSQADRAHAATLRFHLGNLHQLQGDLTAAQPHFATAAADFAVLDRPLEQASALNRQAYGARLLQRHAESARLVQAALAILGPEEQERGYSYFVLGCLAYDARDWASAQGWYEQALAVWRQGEDQRMLAWGLTNLGTALRRLDRLDEAAQVYAQAIQILEQIRDPAHRAIAQMNLGTVYWQQGDLEAARLAYVAAAETFQHLGDDLHLAMVYNNLGIVHARRGQTEAAERALLAAVAGWEKVGNVGEAVNSMDSLGELYRDTGRPDLARSTWQQALDRLSAHADTPAYAYFFDMVSQHLAELG